MKKEFRSSILFAAMFLATGVLALQDRVAAKPEDATPLKVGAKVPAASVREMDNKVANLEEITKGSLLSSSSIEADGAPSVIAIWQNSRPSRLT